MCCLSFAARVYLTVECRFSLIADCGVLCVVCCVLLVDCWSLVIACCCVRVAYVIVACCLFCVLSVAC